MVDAALVTDEASVESSFPGEQHQKPVGLFNPHFQQPERELQYRSYRLHDLQLVQVWGCGFVSLTLGFRLVWAAAHSFTPDSSVFGEHDARVVVSFLLATDFWLAVQMWLIYALQRLGRASHEMDTLEFAARRSSFQGDRRKKKVGEAACTQPTSRLYFLLGVYASVRYSFSKDRIVRLFGGELEVGDDGCRSRRSFETPLIFSLIIAHAYLSQLCRMKPGSFLLIAHLQLACYLGARAGLADAEGLNEDEGSAYYDAAALYVVLLIYYLSLRRTDLAHRREFVRLEQADFVSAEQRAKIAAAEERIVALRTPQLNETQQGALSKEFSDEAVPEQLRRVRIDFSELRVQKMLGCGTFGEVHRAEWRGTPVAVKMIRPSRINAAHLNAFKQECLLHLSMRHPNIVNLLGCAFEAQPGAEGHGQVCALLELCTRGTLEQLLESAQKLSWSAHKLPIALGVARAMAYLHAQAPPVIHRDLKTANVLIDDGFNPKLSDFGLSREATEDATMSTAGSPLFSAPELLRHERYDEQVDVWSYGCVLESLSTHKRTYDDCSELDEHGVRRPKQALVAEGVLRPTLPEGTFLADVLTRCVASDPEERPRFDGLVVELTQPELQLRAAMQPLKCNPALEAAEQRQARAAAAQLATYAPILPRPPPPLAPSLPVLLTPEEDLLAGVNLRLLVAQLHTHRHPRHTKARAAQGQRGACLLSLTVADRSQRSPQADARPDALAINLPHAVAGEQDLWLGAAAGRAIRGAHPEREQPPRALDRPQTHPQPTGAQRERAQHEGILEPLDPRRAGSEVQVDRDGDGTGGPVGRIRCNGWAQAAARVQQRGALANKARVRERRLPIFAHGPPIGLIRLDSQHQER